MKRPTEIEMPAESVSEVIHMQAPAPEAALPSPTAIVPVTNVISVTERREEAS